MVRARDQIRYSQLVVFRELIDLHIQVYPIL
jgi:hypothetical protein